ncbi:YciI family protein [Caballeronia insecticola]|uniref:YCII-related n=1 Tax=Caballeronia insecticola TaxID=758793 RepID=A0A060PHE5_9BURK|nr:YciI family protein [Caballeronia insecticola]BAO94192.1 YCII-related [Caballeronia insecticola]
MLHIVIGSYLQNSSNLHERLHEHRHFMESNHRTGSFLLSGSISTFNGSVIIAQTSTREELMQIIEQDPLQKDGLVGYEVIGFALDTAALAVTEELFLGGKAVSRLFA